MKKGTTRAAAWRMKAVGLRKDMRKIIGFVIIGGTCAALYTLLCIVLTQAAQWPIWAASMFAYAVCVPANYLCQKVLAFQSERAHAVALPRYLATHIGNVVLAAVLSEVLSRIPGLPPTGVFLATAVLVSVTSYVLLDRWAFATHAVPERSS
jgi:putative flippase GtrA